jgi:hypothetical protein
MKIRQLRTDDYKEIIALWLRAVLDLNLKGQDSREALIQQMEANPEFFLGAFERRLPCRYGLHKLTIPT